MNIINFTEGICEISLLLQTQRVGPLKCICFIWTFIHSELAIFTYTKGVGQTLESDYFCWIRSFYFIIVRRWLERLLEIKI